MTAITKQDGSAVKDSSSVEISVWNTLVARGSYVCYTGGSEVKTTELCEGEWYRWLEVTSE